MGLHDSLLDVPERLRVWQLAGVRHFYLDPGLPPAPDVREPGAAATPEASAAVPPPSPPSPVASDLAPDPSRWPAPWPAIFARAPRQPLLVITYYELGLDLTGRADPRRGSLWRRLLPELGLAGRNAVAFWPLALPGDGDACLPDPERFLAGLARLSPRVLAVFGDRAARLLGPEPTGLAGLRREILPDPETLLGGDTEAWNHVLATLGRL